MKTKLTLLFFMVVNIAFSQVEKEYKHAFSVNVNYLLDQWISKSNQQSIFDIHSDHIVLVMYRYRWFRIGAGGVFKEQNTPDPFSASTTWDQSHRAYVLQLGTQGIKNVWEKWDFIYGADLLLQHRKFRSHLAVEVGGFASPNSVWSERIQNEIGLSGFLGVQFHVTQHLSFSTEFSLRLNKSYIGWDSQNNTFLSNPLSFNFNSEDQNNTINFAAPLTLFLNFKF